MTDKYGRARCDQCSAPESPNYTKIPTNLFSHSCANSQEQSRAQARLCSGTSGKNWSVSGSLMLKSALAHKLHHTFTGVFQVVEHLVEALGTAVVRIRHRRFFVFVREAHEEHQLVLVDFGAHLLKGGQIFPVHGQNQIKLTEVICLNLARNNM